MHRSRQAFAFIVSTKTNRYYMLRYKLSLSLLLLLCVSWSKGQEYRPSISLTQLLKQVQQYAPSLLADSMALAIKQAEAVEVGNQRSPDLSLSYQVDYGSNNNLAGPYFGYGIVPSNSGGRRPENNYDPVAGSLGIAAFQWELYNFGAYKAQSDVAQAAVDVEEKRYAQNKYDLQSFTIYAYLQLLRINDQIAIQKRSIDRNKEIGRSIRALARSGIRPGVDTSMAEAELSRARLNEIELVNQQNQLKIRLAAISNLKPEQIVPDTTAEQMLFEQLKADFVLPNETHPHPLLQYYAALLQENKLQEMQITKKYQPKVFLSAALWARGSSIDGNEQYRDLNRALGMQRGNYLVGLGLTYNLFDLRRKKLSLNTQRLASEEALRRLQEQSVNIQTHIAQANADVGTAQLRLEEIPRQVKAANAAYRQKFSLYKNGLTDIVELNVAQNLLYRAERDYVTAKYDYYIALYHKAIAQNNVDPFLQLFN